MTTLIDVVDAVATQLKARLPDVPTVSADRPPQAQRALRLPALFVELAELEPLSQAGDSRLLADARFEVRCLCDPNAQRSDLVVRELASRVMLALNDIRRPVLGHGHVRLLRAGDDAFRPDVEGYLVWVVEFALELTLGELEPVGTTPQEVYIGWPPATGPSHISDYERIE